MEKRVLLAVVLSMAILVVWNTLIMPPPPKPPMKEPAGTGSETAPDRVGLPPDDTESSPTAVTAVPTEAPLPATPTMEGREIVVETSLYRATFTTVGATVTDWELKHYKDSEGLNVRLYEPAPYVLPPLSVIAGDSRAEQPTRWVYESDKDALSLADSESGTLTLKYRDISGLAVTKTFTFRNDSYGVDLDVRVEGVPSWHLALGNGFGLLLGEGASQYVHVGPSLLQGTDRESIKPKDIKNGQQNFDGEVAWIAQEDKYFSSALRPASGTGSAKVWRRNEKLEIGLEAKAPEARFLLYVGPKQYDILKRNGLQDIVDFGFWSFIAHPLFWFLKLLYRTTGNYGIAIILISVLTRLPFIPLMTKSQASMKAMQGLNPKMQELKKKYKDDPQKLQAETMKLYKEAGVNPMAGCMPMLLQIPVFFALYKVLLVSIELRQAPFVLWLKDLSAPDTLFGHFPAGIPLLGGAALGILPILMGITMWLQQRLTPNPSSMDPNQAKIMKFLPVIFTFMFFNLSSGLVLYWTVGNVLSIIQQTITNRRTAAAAAAAAS